MQLTCTVKKLFHFKREIADAKILHFYLEANAPEVSALGPTSLESQFDADVKVYFTRNATKHSFCTIRDLLAVLGLQQEAYPAIWSLLTPKTRPSLGLSPKMGEDLSEMWPNCHIKFHANR